MIRIATLTKTTIVALLEIFANLREKCHKQHFDGFVLKKKLDAQLLRNL